MVENVTTEVAEEPEIIIRQLTFQNEKLTQKVTELTEQLAWFKRQLFGAKSEKLVTIDNDAPALPGFDTDPTP